MYRDITTLLGNNKALKYSGEKIADKFSGYNISKIVVVESRGFLLGSIVAYLLNTGIALVRKKGKLPFETYSANYNLEYGSDTIEIHKDSILPGEKVLLHDDLLATGGTISATSELINKCGGDIVGASFLIELSFLHGRELMNSIGINNIFSLIDFKNED